jgi:hypothetical protein
MGVNGRAPSGLEIIIHEFRSTLTGKDRFIWSATETGRTFNHDPSLPITQSTQLPLGALRCHILYGNYTGLRIGTLNSIMFTMELTGRVGEITGGTILILTPEGSGITKVGGGLLVADGVDELSSMFTGNKTYFERGVTRLVGDEAYARNVVFIKDVGVSAVLLTQSLTQVYNADLIIEGVNTF